MSIGITELVILVCAAMGVIALGSTAVWIFLSNRKNKQQDLE
ncbi:MAG: hypothetical protein PVI04_00315 [Anaerolineales bacterium]|jgi:hypothetical protein